MRAICKQDVISASIVAVLVMSWVVEGGDQVAAAQGSTKGAQPRDSCAPLSAEYSDSQKRVRTRLAHRRHSRLLMCAKPSMLTMVTAILR